MFTMIEHSCYFILRFIRAMLALIVVAPIFKFILFGISLILPTMNDLNFNFALELFWFLIGLSLFFSLRSFINFIHKKRNKGLMHPKLISQWSL